MSGKTVLGRDKLFLLGLVLAVFIALLDSSMPVEAVYQSFNLTYINNTIVPVNTSIFSGTKLNLTLLLNGTGGNTSVVMFYNTSATTWLIADLDGIVGNSTCPVRVCYQVDTDGRRIMVTWNLPADVTRTELRLMSNRSATDNQTHNRTALRFSLDNTNPLLTLIAPTDKSTITDNTPTFTFDANENISSAILYVGGQTLQMTRTDADTFTVTPTIGLADSSYNFEIFASDYARSSNNQRNSHYVTIKRFSGDIGVIEQANQQAALAQSGRKELTTPELKKTGIGAGVGLAAGIVASVFFPPLIVPLLLTGGIGGGLIGIMV